MRPAAIEMLMPTIQPAELWRESGRYDAYGPEMLRIVDRHERELLYGPTNEELITEIFRAAVKSYRRLPKLLYHIQWKFRDEMRPRFGVMRGREFLMKDAYSFDLDRAGAVRAYHKMFVCLPAHLRAHGPEGDPDAGRHRADRRRPQPRVHHPGRYRRERGRLSPRLRHACRWPTGDRLRRRPGADRGRIHEALRRHRREARCRRRGGTRAPAWRRARHRGRPHLLFRHQVFRADAAPSSPDRTARRWRSQMGSYGIGVSRLVGAIIEAQPRRGRHHLAGERGAVRRRPDRPEDRRRRRPAPPASESTTAAATPASRCSTTIATSAPAPSSPRWT